jgi:hypothetical protein
VVRPNAESASGHSTISSGVLSNNGLSFSIDDDRDPQSDDFHGLWEDFGSSKVLNISGKGSGVVPSRLPTCLSKAGCSHAATSPLKPAAAVSAEPARR